MNNVVFILYMHSFIKKIGPYTCTAFINTETALCLEHIARNNAWRTQTAYKCFIIQRQANHRERFKPSNSFWLTKDSIFILKCLYIPDPELINTFSHKSSGPFQRYKHNITFLTAEVFHKFLFCTRKRQHFILFKGS